MARDMGAGRVIASDSVPERLAREFGADVTINLREHTEQLERVKLVRDLTFPLEHIDAFAQAEWSAGNGQVGRVAIRL